MAIAEENGKLTLEEINLEISNKTNNFKLVIDKIALQNNDLLPENYRDLLCPIIKIAVKQHAQEEFVSYISANIRLKPEELSWIIEYFPIAFMEYEDSLDGVAPQYDLENINQTNSNSNINHSSIQGLFPQASQRLLSIAELHTMTKQELRIMRNEIFARHGYIFKTSDMKGYFAKQPWYHAQSSDVNGMLSNIEQQNVTLIKKYE